MPRAKPGFTHVTIEFPDDVLALAKAEAARKGLKLTPWVVGLCARKVKAEFTPPAIGRPEGSGASTRKEPD